MRQAENEKGYALIIVLFAIVFITVLTAVFMKGSMNNKVQEKTVDENNLVVVAAEAGLDYYKWEIEQYYAGMRFEEKFNERLRQEEAKEALNKKNKTSEKIKSPGEIRKEIIKEFVDDLNKKDEAHGNYGKLHQMMREGSKNVASTYEHSLLAAVASMEPSEPAASDPVVVFINGEVEGKGESEKDKQLNFTMRFDFPPLNAVEEEEDNNKEEPPENVGGNSPPVLREPKQVVLPKLPENIPIYEAKCSTTRNIDGGKCTAAGSRDDQRSIANSTVRITGGFTSWSLVKMSNSKAIIEGNFGGGSTSIENSDAVISGGLVPEGGTLTINKSTLTVGDFTTNVQGLIIGDSNITIGNKVRGARVEITNSNIQSKGFLSNNATVLTGTNLRTTEEFKASGGATFTNSTTEIGSSLDVEGGHFTLNNSSVKVSGATKATNGMTIDNTILNTGKGFVTEGGVFSAKDSDIYVGESVETRNGSVLTNVKMNVRDGYRSDVKFDLKNSHVSIGGMLHLGNDGTLANSILSTGSMTSNTSLNFTQSTVFSNYMKSDVMNLTSSQVCITDLSVRQLRMDSGSKIYYSNSANIQDKGFGTNLTTIGTNVIQLSASDFAKTCGASVTETPEEPKEHPVFISPEPPEMESVEY